MFVEQSTKQAFDIVKPKPGAPNYVCPGGYPGRLLDVAEARNEGWKEAAEIAAIFNRIDGVD